MGRISHCMGVGETVTVGDITITRQSTVKMVISAPKDTKISFEKPAQDVQTKLD